MEEKVFLIVDDSDSKRQALAEFVEAEFKGAKVHTATSIKGGLILANQLHNEGVKIDMILSDMQMPLYDDSRILKNGGLVFYTHLIRRDFLNTPVIVVSSETVDLPEDVNAKSFVYDSSVYWQPQLKELIENMWMEVES